MKKEEVDVKIECGFCESGCCFNIKVSTDSKISLKDIPFGIALENLAIELKKEQGRNVEILRVVKDVRETSERGTRH